MFPVLWFFRELITVELIFGNRNGIIGEGSIVAGMVAEMVKSYCISILAVPGSGRDNKILVKIYRYFGRSRCWCPY